MTNELPQSQVPQHKPNLPPAHVAGAQPSLDETLRLLQERVKPYVNLILTVVGGIFLVVFGAWYLHHQGQEREDEAFVRLTEAKDANEIAAFEAQYATTQAHPYILYALGTKRADEAGHDPVKLKAALKDFQRLKELYPNHYITNKLIATRLRELEDDVRWLEDDLAKQLGDLDARRKASDEADKKPGNEKKDEGPGKKEEPPAKKDEPPVKKEDGSEKK